MGGTVTMKGLSRVWITGLLFLFSPAVGLAEPPMAIILSPTDGMVLTKGESLRFEGSGSDVEDGVLKSLVWTSDREGPIGSGESFSLRLSAGSHRITLTVTDSDGEMDMSAVSVIVKEE